MRTLKQIGTGRSKQERLLKGVLFDKIRYLKRYIGNTPLIRLQKLENSNGVRLYAKMEWAQLGQSIKARAAYNIFLHAISSGQLNNDKVLLDATSGNTGIAYAHLGYAAGIDVCLLMPANASKERKAILRELGAELWLCDPLGGTDGARVQAREMALQDPGRYYYADQYNNDRNWQAHFYGTAVEIGKQCPDITHFVAGLGTTGTFTGTSRGLKAQSKNVRCIALQPDKAMHGLEGWKHLPTVSTPGIYDPSLADEQKSVATEEAYAAMRLAYVKEHLILSPSSAANLAGALKVASGMKNGRVVTVFPDDGSRYSELCGEVFKKLIIQS